MTYIFSEQAEEVIYRTRRHVEGVKCDVCEKVIPPRPWVNEESKYFRVTTGHHDWGNDSIDSINNCDVCPDCINNFVADYLSSAGGTQYINIETKHIDAFQYEYVD